ncbi:MAG: hypothetical protein ACHQQS_05045 [Thermoanaerobaculales bacterium]
MPSYILVRSAFAFAVGLAVTVPAYSSAISAEGERLARVLDELDVEAHWPAGVHVKWQTGVPDGGHVSAEGKHTHCSAFAAAAAQRLGIYLLRPPEHGQVLLANAQYDWLPNEGAQQGWEPVAGAIEAQRRANRGDLVVAAYRNRHDDKPGHIAIVHPSAKSDAAVRAEGPQITQAGSINYRSTSLQQGFAGHSAAWSNGEVRYFAHRVDWSAVH